MIQFYGTIRRLYHIVSWFNAIASYFTVIVSLLYRPSFAMVQYDTITIQSWHLGDKSQLAAVIKKLYRYVSQQISRIGAAVQIVSYCTVPYLSNEKLRYNLQLDCIVLLVRIVPSRLYRNCTVRNDSVVL